MPFKKNYVIKTNFHENTLKIDLEFSENHLISVTLNKDRDFNIIIKDDEGVIGIENKLINTVVEPIANLHSLPNWTVSKNYRYIEYTASSKNLSTRYLTQENFQGYIVDLLATFAEAEKVTDVIKIKIYDALAKFGFDLDLLDDRLPYDSRLSLITHDEVEQKRVTLKKSENSLPEFTLKDDWRDVLKSEISFFKNFKQKVKENRDTVRKIIKAWERIMTHDQDVTFDVDLMAKDYLLDVECLNWKHDLENMVDSRTKKHDREKILHYYKVTLAAFQRIFPSNFSAEDRKVFVKLIREYARVLFDSSDRLARDFGFRYRFDERQLYYRSVQNMHLMQMPGISKEKMLRYIDLRQLYYRSLQNVLLKHMPGIDKEEMQHYRELCLSEYENINEFKTESKYFTGDKCPDNSEIETTAAEVARISQGGLFGEQTRKNRTPEPKATVVPDNDANTLATWASTLATWANPEEDDTSWCMIQ